MAMCGTDVDVVIVCGPMDCPRYAAPSPPALMINDGSGTFTAAPSGAIPEYAAGTDTQAIFLTMADIDGNGGACTSFARCDLGLS